MRRSEANFVHRFILPVAIILPLAAAAQTPAPIQLRGAGIPRKLTLAQAEQLLLQRNLAVLAARYQVDAISLAREAELQALTDVEKAYLAYQSARRILNIYGSSTIERAGRLKTIATLSYQEGATSLLELLDAERGYNQTISSYNQARADYQSALWQLEQAVGRPLR
jgi:outer membrane efflux protein